VQRPTSPVGLSDPTDVELEYISQARSDHCNHNTFRGRFHYRDMDRPAEETIDSLFKTCIEGPTLELKAAKTLGGLRVVGQCRRGALR
jgi:phosphoribosylformylglycinamidine (FGAM) synthase-like enzyme